jgi:RNA polymerase sigma-70 factor (ECF subfamily)
VAAAIRGDREAMRALWQEHRRWIAAVLLAHKPPHEQLDDLLQEVAMTLVRKIGNLRDPQNIRAWLRTVAVNAARASARSAKARPWLRGAGSVGGESSPIAGDPVALDDEARKVLGLASRLPEAYREPLMLRAVHGLRGKHIAEILDLPEATVETRITRARRMLREGMGAFENESRPAVATSVAGGIEQRG